MPALARLATGRPGPETEAMIAGVLPPIDDCWDCADFYLVPLLWVRARYAATLCPAPSGGSTAPSSATATGSTSPATTCSGISPRTTPSSSTPPPTSPATSSPTRPSPAPAAPGAEQSAVGAARVRAWLDHFERWEMAEFNSAPYFPIDLKGLTALPALAPDADIRARAARGIARLLEIVANSAHQGILTAAQGRSYEHSLRAAASLELSAIARLLWGRGSIGARLHALPQLALCLRDHGLALPDLAARAIWQSARRAGMVLPPGRERLRRPQSHKTRAWALGTAAPYRWGEWGYQETLVHARLGTEPQAQISDQPPRRAPPVRLRPPLLLGRQRLDPRVQQYRALALVAFDGAEPQPDLTHAWFPAAPSTKATSRPTPPSPAPAKASPPSSPTAPSKKYPGPQRPLRAPPRRPPRPLAPPPGRRATTPLPRPLRRPRPHRAARRPHHR